MRPGERQRVLRVVMLTAVRFLLDKQPPNRHDSVHHETARSYHRSMGASL